MNEQARLHELADAFEIAPFYMQQVLERAQQEVENRKQYTGHQQADHHDEYAYAEFGSFGDQLVVKAIVYVDEEHTMDQTLWFVVDEKYTAWTDELVQAFELYLSDPMEFGG